MSLTVRTGEVGRCSAPTAPAKSTTLRAITGLLTPKAAESRSTATTSPAARAQARRARHLNVARRTWRLRDLTVLENLEMGAYLTRTRRPQAQSRARLHLISAPQRTCEAARRPRYPGASNRCSRWRRSADVKSKLLLLDEPSLGLAPIVCQTIFSTIDGIKAEGTTVLVSSRMRMQR